MRPRLEVMTLGSWKGKLISVPAPSLVIGRDAGCQLRPASPLISARHCELFCKGDRLFVRDLESASGIFVNDEAVRAECELRSGDRLRVGPLLFTVRLPPAPTKAPAPATKEVASADTEDSFAALLLDGDSGGETVAASAEESEAPAAAPAAPASGNDARVAKEAADTSKAAQAILEKYRCRPRG